MTKTIKIFHKFVETLMNNEMMPNNIINELMEFGNDLYKSNMVTITENKNIEKEMFLFSIEHKSGQIVLPSNWLEKVEEAPVDVSAIIIFLTSKAKDFYNNVLMLENGFSDARGAIYVAEYLKTIKEMMPEYQLSPLCKELTGFYKKGLDEPFAGVLMYKTKEFKNELVVGDA